MSPLDFGKDKMGGIHTTIIGGREGRNILYLVAAYPKVKKIIPGIIQVKGAAGGIFRAKVLRSDNRGNLRLLFSHGSSVQEIRLVTTGATAEEGEFISNDLNRLIQLELKE